MEDIFKELSLEISEAGHNPADKSVINHWVETVGDSKIIMLGEASHGTHEFYTWRTHLTRELIEKKNFSFVAVEGDWPDCYAINRYIKGYPGSGSNSKEVLDSFNRWPSWMWANWEVSALMEWLKENNHQQKQKTGFYGLDVYSLWESLDAIVNLLGRDDQKTRKTALEAIRCFEPYRDDMGQLYAHSTRWLPEGCTEEVVNLLHEIKRKRILFERDDESAFDLEQNGHVVKNAEDYYRAMIQSSAKSWNIRDQHMMETLNNLLEFHGPDAKAIVWAHNTHIGDARATDMKRASMVNIGQLAREKYGKARVHLTGFGTYTGTVIAAHEWGDTMQEMQVPDAKKGSWENLVHGGANGNCLLFTSDLKNEVFQAPIGHRAIGVVYDPMREMYGNYVPTIIPQRYDSFLHIESTKALHPLHKEKTGKRIPETYPFGV